MSNIREPGEDYRLTQIMMAALKRIEAGSKPVTAAQGSLADQAMALIAREAIAQVEVAQAQTSLAESYVMGDVTHIREAEYRARYVIEKLGQDTMTGGRQYKDSDLIINTGKEAMLSVYFYGQPDNIPSLRTCLVIANTGYLRCYDEPVRPIPDSEESRPWQYFLNQLFHHAEAAT